MGGPPGSVYGWNDAGWMKDKNFEGWFTKFFIPQAKAICGQDQPLVLCYDGHNSHITYTTVMEARKYNIAIVCLPPHTSHAFQPLDVGVFKSVKINYKQIVTKWYKESRCKNMTKT